ncbi:MAG: amino acid ABC transporter permease [Candidatus Izemoplasmatales bacterium]|nr:amino acid ABC transporter permease [Candidatus Izemoplasmatales bacterium]
MKFLRNPFVMILFLVIALGVVNVISPGAFTLFSTTVEAEVSETDDPELIEAMNGLVLYSEFNYQTLTQAKLDQLSYGFYLPIQYGDVSIAWSSDSSRFDIASVPETIPVMSQTGPIDIEVLHVQVLSLPSALQGNDPFIMTATFSNELHESQKQYTGQLVPVMPDDFWGGVFFTFFRYLSLFVEGVLTTLLLSLAGTVIGFVIAILLVLMRSIRPARHEATISRLLRKGLQGFAKFYVTIFRGTPMIVQAAFFWYGLGLFGDAMLCGLFVVSVNTAAYIAEILRGGISSVDTGQMEAARSLGLSYVQTMRYVILPQAIKNAMPAIGNEFVINIKDTSVLSIIGIFELFNQTRRIAGMHYRQLEAYFVVALIYLFLTYTVTHLLQKIEKRLDMPVKELTSSN